MMHLLKKLLPILLSISMMMTTTPVMAQDADFSDMPSNWATTPLKHAIANGLMFGSEGKIMPNAPLTRAQLAAMVNRAFGATDKASLAGFTDVQAGAWYVDDMAKAVRMLTFVGDGKRLNPNAEITREEAFAVLARAFKISGASQTVLNAYSDGESVSQWARDSVASLVAYGIVTGSGGNLNPRSHITRAEIARTFDNIIAAYIRKAGTYEQDIDNNVMITTSGVILKNMKITGTLVIGDGVGDGDVTLDGVEVTNGMIVRGGGLHSVKIIGTSMVPVVIVARVKGKTRLLAGEGAQVGEVLVDGRDDVVIDGDVASLSILSSGITVTTGNASIASASVTGPNAGLAVTSGSAIAKVTISSDRVRIAVAHGAEVREIAANGTGAVIEGPGIVRKVTVKGNGTTVATPGTEVIAAVGVIGTVVGSTTLTESDIPLSPPVVGSIDGGATGGDDTGGGGSGGGSGGGVIYVPVTSIAAISGVAREDDTVVAGSVTPNGAAVAYQWKSSDTVDGAYASIPGATARSWKIAKGYAGKYLKVSATGFGIYTGTVMSPATSAILVNAEDITAAAIRMAVPHAGATPQDAETVELATGDPDFTVEQLTWHEDLTDNGAFRADQVYTATVRLRSGNLKEFQEDAFTPEVAGAQSVGPTTTSGRDVGNEAWFTVTFPATEALTVAGIAVTTQPAKMTYMVSEDPELVDDELTLDGLVVTKTWNDGKTEDYGIQDWTAEGITAFPAEGTKLGAPDNGLRVTITHIASGCVASTGALSVKVDPPDITGAAIVIVAPEAGAVPGSATVVETATANADFTVTHVLWHEVLTANGSFAAGQAYSATITLMSKNGKEFSRDPFTPVVEGSASVTQSVTSGSGIGNAVVFTALFADTAPLTITGIAVTTQPDMLAYVVDATTSSAMLALKGMVVTATWNDGSTMSFAFPDGTAEGFTTDPMNGTEIDLTHNGVQVTITHDETGLTAQTEALSVTLPATLPDTPAGIQAGTE